MRYESPPFERPVQTVKGVDLDISGGVGPAPGELFETGAVKGVGSIAVPMAPHEVRIDVVKPSGKVHACRGRSEEIGIFTCPAGPLVLDEPGVYRVLAEFRSGSHKGVCPGSRGGWYRIYAIEKGTPYRVLFDPSLERPVGAAEALTIHGRVTPTPSSGTVYYSVVMPGMLLDEGQVPLEKDGRFAFRFLPAELGTEFANFLDAPTVSRSALTHTSPLSFAWKLLAGFREQRFFRTVEINVFVEGVDAPGAAMTAGGKCVARRGRFVIPQPFLDERHAALH